MPKAHPNAAVFPTHYMGRGAGAEHGALGNQMPHTIDAQCVEFIDVNCGTSQAFDSLDYRYLSKRVNPIHSILTQTSSISDLVRILAFRRSWVEYIEKAQLGKLCHWHQRW